MNYELTKNVKKAIDEFEKELKKLNLTKKEEIISIKQKIEDAILLLEKTES